MKQLGRATHTVEGGNLPHPQAATIPCVHTNAIQFHIITQSSTSSYNTTPRKTIPMNRPSMPMPYNVISNQQMFTSHSSSHNTIPYQTIQDHACRTNHIKTMQFHVTSYPEYHSPHHTIRIRTIPYHTTQYQYHTRSHSIQNHPQYHTTA